MDQAPVVETRALTKRYGRVASLENCTLSICGGEVFGLLGPNGAGKTTLLRLLLGFIRPTSGKALIEGLDCYHQSLDVRRRVAYLPGEARLFRRMRGRDVLQFFSRLRGAQDSARPMAVADRLSLDLSRRVATMSTGMRQKLALAAVMSIDAPLVILDEPTSNLDPTARAEVMALVAEAQQAGRTVIFSSHVLSEVETACDRVVLLRQGELVHVQAMHELRRRHRIRARIAGELPPLSGALGEQVSVRTAGDNELVMETDGELAPVLSWLAQAPLTEVRIEPIGLRAVYDRFHAVESTEAADL